MQSVRKIHDELNSVGQPLIILIWMLDEEKTSQAASILEKRRSVGSLTGDWQWVVTVDFAAYLLSFCESSGLSLLDHRLRLPCMQDRCLICGYQQESCLRWMLNCPDLLKLRNFWAQLRIQHELPQEHWCLRLWCLQIFRYPLTSWRNGEKSEARCLAGS